MCGRINLFNHIVSGVVSRVVYAMIDNKWVFCEEGESMWFEDIMLYKKSAIRNRMNREILISYCEKLGLDIRDDNFWQSDNILHYKRLIW